MKFKQYLLAGAAFAALSIGSAAAADLPVKAYTPAPVVPQFSWTGFYFGGHMGGGWANKQFGDDGSFSCYYACEGTTLGGHTATGVLGGLQAGYNWQTGNWVFGIEGEYSWANLKGNNSGGASNSYTYGGYCDGYCTYGQTNSAINERISTKVSSVGTIAGRIGIASDFGFGRTLFYVKGGGAVVRDKYYVSGNGSSTNQEQLCYYSSCGSPYYSSDAASFTGSASATRWGWLLGTGLEFALNQNWSAKVEYDYMDFGSKDVTFAISGSGYDNYGSYRFNTSRTVKVDQTLQVVKIGVNYRFAGWGGGGWGW